MKKNESKPLKFCLLFSICLFIGLSSFKMKEKPPINAGFTYREETISYYDVNEEEMRQLTDIQKMALQTTAEKKFVEIMQNDREFSVSETVEKSEYSSETQLPSYDEEMVKSVLSSDGTMIITNRKGEEQVSKTDAIENSEYIDIIKNELFGNVEDFTQRISKIKELGAEFQPSKNGYLEATYKTEEGIKVVVSLDEKASKIMSEKYFSGEDLQTSIYYDYNDEGILSSKTTKSKTEIPLTDVSSTFIQTTFYTDVKQN